MNEASPPRPDPASLQARASPDRLDGARVDPPENKTPGPDLGRVASTFLVRCARWHALLVAIAASASTLTGSPDFAISLALGALLMYANLTMATRTLLRAFRGAGEVPQSPATALAWATRWPLLALALVGILWYMPARPEGIALGIGLSLLSSVITALRLSQADPNHG